MSSSTPRPVHAARRAVAHRAARGAPSPRRRPAPRSICGPCGPGRPTTTWPGAHGFVPERDLLQMRVALPLARRGRGGHPAPRHPARSCPAATRRRGWRPTTGPSPATPSRAGGRSTSSASAWRPTGSTSTGFLVADDPDGTGLIGSCWTKVHRDRHPVLGRDLRDRGRPAPPRAGLGALPHRGRPRVAWPDVACTVGMLYTDATNEAAVALYRSLGFTVDHVDRSYRRDPAVHADRRRRSADPPTGGRRHEPQLTPVPMARPTPKVTPAATTVTASCRRAETTGEPLGEARQHHADGERGHRAQDDREHDGQSSPR